MRKTTVVSVVVFLLAGSAMALAQCVCPKAKVADGWCQGCKVGYVAGVKIKSARLFEAVQGKAVSADKIRCKDCQQAAKRGCGWCDKCKAGIVAGKGYHSPVAYALAQGQHKDPATIKCPKCRQAAKDHGWCSDCKEGYAGTLVFTGKEKYEKAAKARQTLIRAARLAEKCESCAAAMVSDGTCSRCKVSFKDGKPTTGSKSKPRP